MKPAAVSVPVLMTEWGTAIWTQGMHMNASIVHSYLHLLPYYMRDNGWDGSFAWNWDPSLGGTPMVNSITPPFHYTDWGDYARNVMLGNMPPYADIEASGNLYVGGAVDIKDSLGWGVTARDWDFGDGSAHGTERNVTHVYRTPGTYTLTLIATNSSYIDTMYSLDVITKDITITATSTSSQASDSCLFIGLIAGAAGSIFNFLESFI
jgi:PKD repeat protein